jgi:dienelactone hydrolase
MAGYRWAVGGLVVWLAGTAVAYGALHHGVEVRDIDIKLPDGSTIHGVLYRNRQADDDVPAALILHGTAVSHSSCAPALSFPLAQSGFTVLAIDLPGHGRSDGHVERSDYVGFERLANVGAGQAAIDAALDFLRSERNIDPNALVLIGYSRGGWMAASAACRRADIAGVVALCSAPPADGSSTPRNLLILAPGLDLIVPRKAYQSAMANLGDQLSPDCILYGDFDLGTARMLWFSPWSTHLSFMAEPIVSERAGQWAFCSTGRAPATVAKAGAWAAIVASAVAMAGAMVLLFWLLGKSTAYLLGPTITAERPQLLLPSIAALFGLLVVATPAAAYLGGLLPDGGALFSSQVVALLATLALIASAVGVLKAMATTRLRTQPLHSPVDVSAAQAETFGKGPMTWMMRGAVLGAFGFALELSLWGLTLGSIWLDFPLTSRRMGLGISLFLLALPCCLLLAVGVQRTIGPSPQGWRGAAIRGGVWLSLAGAIFVGHVLLVRSWSIFFAVPMLSVVATSIGPLPLWILPDRRGLTTGRAINHALSVACFLAFHLPFAGPA